MIEERKLRIMARKAGGTAGKNSFAYSVVLPSKWIKKMGFFTEGPEDRQAIISFNGECIMIRKKEKTEES